MKHARDSKRAPARAAALLVAIASVPACSAVLGLDDKYTDVVKALCECTQQLPAECDTTLRTNLAEADPIVVEGWLNEAKALDCGGGCGEKALRCYYTAPKTCHPKGESCALDAQCCGHFEAAPELICNTMHKCTSTCASCASVIAEESLSGANLCAASAVLLASLTSCASEKAGAASKCPPCFEPLFNWDLCSACLETQCKTELDACNADGSSAPFSRSGAAFAALLLAAFATIAASCTQALGLEGQHDVNGEICPFIDKCYGDLLPGCDNHIDERIQGFKGGDLDAWLRRTETAGCLDSCSNLRICLDYEAACTANGLGGTCTIDENCCGFTSGEIACEDGACCRPLGADCATSNECCPNAGFCEDFHCGGVVCAKAGEVCLNDFSAAPGGAARLTCARTSPARRSASRARPTAIAAKILICDPASKRCAHAPCALEGQSCLTAGDCWDPSYVCNTQGGVGGVCSPSACNPDSSDCFNDDQCCSGHCIGPPYKLCGDCVESGSCSAAVPCCGTSKCVDGECSP